MFLAAVIIGFSSVTANAEVVEISFDLGPDGVFTESDGNVSPMTATPNTYGTLGHFTSNGLLCFGNAVADFGGSPTFDGLFNVDAAGNFTAAMTFTNGTFIDASTGTTGWGVISSIGVTPGLVAGTYNVGIRTSTGNFGWMNLTLDDNGTPNSTNDDTITLNGVFVETNVGQGITINENLLVRTSVPVPTTSEWGLFVLVLLLLASVVQQFRVRWSASRETSIDV